MASAKHLNLCFPICRIATITAFVAKIWGELNEFVHIKQLKLYLSLSTYLVNVGPPHHHFHLNWLLEISLILLFSKFPKFLNNWTHQLPPPISPEATSLFLQMVPTTILSPTQHSKLRSPLTISPPAFSCLCMESRIHPFLSIPFQPDSLLTLIWIIESPKAYWASPLTNC